MAFVCLLSVVMAIRLVMGCVVLSVRVVIGGIMARLVAVSMGII